MFELNREESEVITIIVMGVGGGGNNAVNRMIDEGITGVEFIVINTDEDVPHSTKAEKRIQIGERLTHGLGAGANPQVGFAAATESQDAIREAIEGCDLLLLTAGMGGGTGTGATPVVARLAKEMGILVVAIVTKPFRFEGRARMKQAQEGIDKLRQYTDALIVVENDKLISVSEPGTTLDNAFKMADDVLRQGIQGITDLITHHGIINVDFADVRTILTYSGFAYVSVGKGKGEDAAVDAAEQAIHSPLLETPLNRCKGIIGNVTGGENLTLSDYNLVAQIISRVVDEESNVIIGYVIDPKLKSEVKVTIIATGLD